MPLRFVYTSGLTRHIFIHCYSASRPIGNPAVYNGYFLIKLIFRFSLR